MDKESPVENEPKSGFFARLKSGLTKTRSSLAGGFDNIVHGKAKVGPELLEELEETLLIADVGMQTTSFILDDLKREVSQNRVRENKEVLEQLKQRMVRVLSQNQKALAFSEHQPFVILVVGVNGSGKTTTIGKLARHWKQEGKKVLLAAGDTFRAAAIDQLQVWADRSEISCISQKSGADPSAVAYDAVQAGLAREMDLVIIDTAGRLQTNTNLMEELKKIKRVIGKVLPGAPHETLLVLDATIGQNSISQARLFNEALTVDGLVMTKLDGTAKGGVLFNITDDLKLPIRFVGVGEKPEDLQEFNPETFVEALIPG
ncbi:MAG: signal recognition particle-docking protein FtsY [Nitrospina sp.]|jgi:fused signal recognition particle receptor|nr:signal recognition particle-docking protein FtsY [Nitrospina sp.]MBT3415027.1 signal recognition particle-docking protein FtsY [Nitrospina sp.]MBT3856817.1 signal recognition particle-docking protein FtsY [Nitrospina sp.]MBT4104157.1 signal recognition particle-docking protein FtsY [Nitrospina sp.]MBT4388175.1 signal recognition particle-docking protein FtsY [Nitrospina sp.]